MTTATPITEEVSQTSIRVVEKHVGTSLTKSYTLLRHVIEVVRDPSSQPILGCLPVGATMTMRRRAYKNAFLKCWRLMNDDERWIVQDQLHRYIFSKSDSTHRHFADWKNSLSDTALEPDQIFFQIASQPHIITDRDFAPIWNALSKVSQARLRAIWWRIIKCACQIEKDHESGNTGILWITFPSGDRTQMASDR